MRISPTHLRLALTVFWAVLLALYFRHWELTLRFPHLLLWTVLFALPYLGTAVAVRGDAELSRRHPVWRRIGAWVSLAVIVAIVLAVVPAVTIRGVPVRTAVFAGVLDAIVPLWITASAVALLWEGIARVGAFAAFGVVLVGSLWFFVIRMPGRSFTGPLEPLTAEQQELARALESHVRVLAAEIGPRNDEAYDALEAAAQYLDSTLSAMGYRVSAQTFEVVGKTFRNLEVEISGTRRADEIVVIGAHYDSVDEVPGADDNATGVAAVLELARRFARARPERTIRFVLFTNEEPPYFTTRWMGSHVYARRAADRGDRIVAMLSLETIGFYRDEPGSQSYPPPFSFFYPRRGDFIGFVGNLGSGRLVRRALATFRRSVRFPSEGVASPGWIPGVGWSDHWAFWRHGYRAIMITDTAPFRNPFYHTQHDTIDTLDFARMARVVEGLTAVVQDLAGG